MHHDYGACADVDAVERHVLNLLDEFLSHWRSIPRENGVPTLSAYLDRVHPRIQPWTMIADINHDAMPIRLFGTRMIEMMGRDFTGMDYLLASNEQSRPHVLARDQICARHPCGLRISLTARTATGRSLNYTVMGLPVRRTENQSSLIQYTAIEETQNWRELPTSVLTCDGTRWVDIGAGVPPEPPWTDPRYCS